ncbi:hypothetical protein GBAR_LOCUS14187, partial [Geodia barretti]
MPTVPEISRHGSWSSIQHRQLLSTDIHDSSRLQTQARRFCTYSRRRTCLPQPHPTPQYTAAAEPETIPETGIEKTGLRHRQVLFTMTSFSTTTILTPRYTWTWLSSIFYSLSMLICT